MLINRRGIIKAIALAPALTILESSLARKLISARSQSSTYILLHGLFFMEFYKSKLYVATPNHGAHHFCVRRSGGELQKCPSDIPLYDSLGHGSVSSFPTEIPQFSKSLIGPFGPRTAKKYRCKMVLPLPKNVFAYRTDTKDKFLPERNNTIGQAIWVSTGPRLATITCLEFDAGADGPYVESYYAEHKTRPSTDEVNAALGASTDICGSKFNLRLQPINPVPPPAPIDPAGTLPYGVTQDDENELEDLLSGGKPACDEQPGPPTVHEKGADVASCPQFGINP